MEQRWHSKSRGLYFCTEKETKINWELFYHRILSAGKKVECVSDRIYIFERSLV